MKNPIVKMCLAGLLLALTIIFTRFLSFQNIPVLPFVRISLGPCLIIFSSIFLGPIYGMAVGALSDIFGIILVPNALGYGINPWFTLVYGLLGLIPYFLYKLIKLIKNEKIIFLVILIVMIGLLSFVGIYGFLNDSIMGHQYNLATKIITFIILTTLSILLLLSLFFIKKKYPDNKYVYNIAFVSLISEIAIMLILNSIVKYIFFEVDFIVIFFFQTLVFFIDVPLNTLFMSFLFKINEKTNTIELKL